MKFLKKRWVELLYVLLLALLIVYPVSSILDGYFTVSCPGYVSSAALNLNDPAHPFILESFHCNYPSFLSNIILNRRFFIVGTVYISYILSCLLAWFVIAGFYKIMRKTKKKRLAISENRK
jgi:hypothetical protein